MESVPTYTAHGILKISLLIADPFLDRPESNMTSRFSALFLLLITVPIFQAAPAGANNNLFLPGDAFFPSVLTTEDLKHMRQEAAGTRTFTYSSMDGYEMAFCGDAGYERATLESVDDAFADNLMSAYSKLRQKVPRQFVEEREDGERRLVETNGMRVLFYHESFQFPEYKLGLRYNENWADEAVQFGHKRNRIRLCCLLRNPLAVELSWRDAKTVAPLLRGKKVISRKKNSPPSIVINEELKAIVFSPYSLDDLFLVGRNEYRHLFVVDSDGIGELRHRDGKWGPPADDDGPF